MKSFDSSGFRFLVLIGIILILVAIATSGLILFEYLSGNGDGIWLDIPLAYTAFKIMAVISFCAVIFYLLLFSHQILRGLTRTILLTVLLLIGVEFVFKGLVSWSNKSSESGTIKPSTPFLRPDWTNSFVLNDTLGVKVKPDWHLKWAPVKDGIVYDSIEINTDSLSRRVTKLTEGASPQQYAIFFGCSYTYGDGVNDDETLPYYFQSFSKDFQSYNYGFLAYSPLHMLARLQQMKVREEIVQKDGVGFFTLINDHLDRVIPASRWIELTKGHFPYVDKKTMVTSGVFSQRRRLYSDFIQEFQHTGTKQFLRWGYPKTHSEEHFDFLADILAESSRDYKRIFGNDSFYVLIFPGNPVSKSFLKKLSDRGVKYLDYSGLITIKDKMLPFDSAHPSAEVYHALASQLSKDLATIRGEK